MAEKGKNTNKVIVNGETILDLTQDTVTPATLAKGTTAHDKSGKQITGSMEKVYDFVSDGPGMVSGNIDFKFPIVALDRHGNDIQDGYLDSNLKYYALITKTRFGSALDYYVLEGQTFTSTAGLKIAGTMPNNGAAAIQLSDLTAKSVTAGYYSGGTAKVADAEAAKIIPENIKKGVTILGVEGTMEASAGGDYNIAATTNADGTQNLAITDAAGGGSGGGRPPVSLTITVDPTGAPEEWAVDVYGPSGSLFNFDANNLTFTIPDCTAGDMFAVWTYPDVSTGYLEKSTTVCVNCYFDITYSAEDYIANKSAPCAYACQIDETLSAGAEATMTIKFH